MLDDFDDDPKKELRKDMDPKRGVREGWIAVKRDRARGLAVAALVMAVRDEAYVRAAMRGERRMEDQEGAPGATSVFIQKKQGLARICYSQEMMSCAMKQNGGR
jgi:hypothetical protein